MKGNKKLIEQIEDTLSWFMEQMRKKLLINIDRPGWRVESLAEESDFFLGRLEDEVNELQEAISQGNDVDLIIEECADIANFAMMLADIHKEE